MAQAARKPREDEIEVDGGMRYVVARSRRQEEIFELCDRMMDIAAALFAVSGRELRDSSRANNNVARVRQVAMYVTHVTFGITMKDVGIGFGRDRTTVMHACHTIEDLRDDDEFDRIIALAERVAAAALASRTYR